MKKKDTPSTEKKPLQPHQWVDENGDVLIVRRTNRDRKSYGGFAWPSGIGTVVECPDWNPAQICGYGLHGWPWGFGLGEGSDFNFLDDIWMVLAAKPEDVVGELDNGWKCKARKVTIKYEGDFKSVINIVKTGFHDAIREMASLKSKLDDNASGDYSTQAASGNSSKQAASGDSSTQAASGDYSKQAASGNSSKQAASGNYSTQAASGYSSTQAASGDYSKQAASGNSSKQAASGENALSMIANQNGRIKTGNRGAFALAYWDEETGWEILTAKVGREGVEAGTWYEIRDKKIVPCQNQNIVI